MGRLILPSACDPTCDNLLRSLPPLPHHCNDLQPPPHTHSLGSPKPGACTLHLPSGWLHPMTVSPEVAHPLPLIGQRKTQTLFSVLPESPPRGCETRLLFSRQHPLTALPKWLVPISCWRLFNHLTQFFNFHCSYTYISIPANGLPRELSSPKF